MNSTCARLIATPLLLITMIGSSIGQNDSTDTEQRSFKEATYFGGGLGLQFGTITSIQVSPSLAYKVDRKGKLSTGIGLMYWYYRDNRFTPAFESSTYGYSLFSRFRVVESIFLHAEFQQQSVQVGNAALVDGDNNLPREWVPLLLVGGGYSAHLGGNSYLIAQVLWDVIQDRRSPYLVGQPFFSVGVGVGF